MVAVTGRSPYKKKFWMTNIEGHLTLYVNVCGVHINEQFEERSDGGSVSIMLRCPQFLFPF